MARYGILQVFSGSARGGTSPLKLKTLGDADRLVMIRKPFALASIFGVLFIANATFACVCADDGGVAEQYRSADAVFIGRIIALEIETVRVEGEQIHHMVATFKVERRWKGPRKGTIRVGTCGTQTDICTCGANFLLGGSYVVFAKGKPLRTGSCEPTDAVESATETIHQLETMK